MLRNVRVPTPKRGLDGADASPTRCAAVEAELGEQGRVLLRPSGTEPLVRVMVEAPTAEEAEGCRRPAGRGRRPGVGGPEPGRRLWRCAESSPSSARGSSRPVPDGPDLLEQLDRAIASLEAAAGERATMAELVLAAADEVGSVDAALRGVPGVQALLQQADLADAVEARVDAISDRIGRGSEKRARRGRGHAAGRRARAVNAAFSG